MGKLSPDALTNASAQFAFMRKKILRGEPFEEGAERDAVIHVLETLEEVTRDYLELAMWIEKKRGKT